MTVHKQPRLKDNRRKSAPLPAFTPVPRKCQRHDGWTPQRQTGFIEALADTGSVKTAARTMNMTPESAYYLRRQPGAESFRKAWEAALALGVQRLEDVAMERALNGVEVPVYHFGAVVGTRRIYNDRLLMFLLRNRAPERFAADGARGLSALDRTMLARLKKEWRAEWERELTTRWAEEEAATVESINRKLDMMRERMEEAERDEDARAAEEAAQQDDQDGQH
ncbi:hypothetical protein [Croceicoccus bisphenolivorans]|uniref:hypothetical protein n=1 Tax=Croceicoccus bisphenolivorans TaxID=1783232 RepID=UPI000AD3203D|nr:hypothetical protein [Croceicoccus bisphenolivorans]